MENRNHKNKNIERKYLKVKNSLLELEKDLIELNCIEMRDKVVKIKKEIENMDRFEEEEMKKIRPIINTWCDCLINCIPKPIRKSAIVLKDKFISLFKTNTPKQTVYGRGQKLSKPRKQNIKNPFISKVTKQIIKDRIIEIFGNFLKQKKRRRKKGIREKEKTQ